MCPLVILLCDINRLSDLNYYRIVIVSSSVWSVFGIILQPFTEVDKRIASTKSLGTAALIL